MPNKTVFTSTSYEEKKPWGNTRVWKASGAMHGKIITIDAGKRTSLKYNSVKNEVFYVISGSVRVTYGDSNTSKNDKLSPYKTEVLEAGSVLSVQSECPYRIHALEDSTLIEIADKHNDQRVIIEDDYGRS